MKRLVVQTLRIFFLLGNGELYHRFLEQAQPLFAKPPTEEAERGEACWPSLCLPLINHFPPSQELKCLWREAIAAIPGENKSFEISLVLPRAKNDPKVLLGRLGCFLLLR